MEIIALVSHFRQLTLQIPHVVVELFQLDRQITRPILDVIAIGLVL
jgi:hypothetical protein